jgi:hypothetical protein
MSVTTTANASVITLRSTLAEYELHHSEVNPNPEGEGQPAPPPNTQPDIASENPPVEWDTSHRRVPPYSQYTKVWSFTAPFRLHPQPRHYVNATQDPSTLA